MISVEHKNPTGFSFCVLRVKAELKYSSASSMSLFLTNSRLQMPKTLEKSVPGRFLRCLAVVIVVGCFQIFGKSAVPDPA